jgi:hypothetical protein
MDRGAPCRILPQLIRQFNGGRLSHSFPQERGKGWGTEVMGAAFPPISQMARNGWGTDAVFCCRIKGVHCFIAGSKGADWDANPRSAAAGSSAQPPRGLPAVRHAPTACTARRVCCFFRGTIYLWLRTCRANARRTGSRPNANVRNSGSATRASARPSSQEAVSSKARGPISSGPCVGRAIGSGPLSRRGT